MTVNVLFIVHFAATWFLAGLWWLVQRVQDPLMAQVDVEHFRAYEVAHVARLVATNWIRTLAWSARGLLLAVQLASMISVDRACAGAE